MKKLFVLFALLAVTVTTNAQTKAADILGTYLNQEGEAIIKISENAGKYFGKLVWMKRPEKLDEHNPDKTKQSQKLLGTTIMNNFVFDDDTWEDGTIYDPKNGKTYDCKVTRDAKGNLDIRGFIGISLLGRTSHWTKIDYKEK